MLKYSEASIVLQEVPGEISLAISVSGCPLRCDGCHSAQTWNPELGKYLTVCEIDKLLLKHKHVTCILFYGGEWEANGLITLCDYIKDKGLKLCLYTGYELKEINSELVYYLDFIKTGPYIEELGGLGTEGTNQRFIRL